MGLGRRGIDEARFIIHPQGPGLFSLRAVAFAFGGMIPAFWDGFYLQSQWMWQVLGLSSVGD
jgi:hypothetical protein